MLQCCKDLKMKHLFKLLFLATLVSAQNDDYSARVDCAPDGKTELCRDQRGCIHDQDTSDAEAPPCYFPPNYGYALDGEVEDTTSGLRAKLVRNSDLDGVTFVGGDFETLTLEAEFQTEERLRLRITPDEDPGRHEVPISIQGSGDNPASPLYQVQIEQDEENNVASLKVLRSSTGTVIFDTSLGGFIYSDQFLQIATKLPSSNIYGLGENEQPSYRHDMNWKTWVGHNRDTSPSGNANIYGTHPTYTVLEEDGNAHTVLFLNSNAQEWVMTPYPGFVYRTIGGILDIYFFLGPTPSDTNSQYSEAVGRYPLPPYWALGFHLCRWGYNTLENMQATRERMAENGIPQDAQWADIDIMDTKQDFTINQENFAGLPEYVEELKQEGIKFVTILDPVINSEGGDDYEPLVTGNELDVWVKQSDGASPAVGKSWPEAPVYYADFSNPDTQGWWHDLIVDFHDEISFDALWIDMNEPSNFVDGVLGQGCPAENKYNSPPYLPHVRGNHGLHDRTLCADSIQHQGVHYDIHNMYGWFETEPTAAAVQDAVGGGRSWVLSRSTFIGSGRWSAHWLGDNFSTWDRMFYSIIGMLQFNRFGMPHVGADICGFAGNTEVELCARWHQLGAFYPFSRNHNGLGYIDQDPGALGEPVVTSARNALLLRYRFLPYLYTLFYKHYTDGVSVARALWDEWPRDETTWDIDGQFLLGPSILVSPVLTEGATNVDAYFPDARWFDVSNWIVQGVIREEPARNVFTNLDAPIEVINVHVRGGTVFALQKEDLNTELSRKNPWQLLVALDDDEEAVGELFMDDGVGADTVDSGDYFLVDFAASVGSLTSAVVSAGHDMSGEFVERLDVVGMSAAGVASVTANGDPVFDFEYADGRLQLTGLQLPIGEPIEILWF